MTDRQAMTPLRLAADNQVVCIYSPPKPAHPSELEANGIKARGRYRLPKPTELEVAASESAGIANREKASAFLFEESFWDIETVLNWIAHLDRHKLLDCWRYSPETIRPHYTFIEACRTGLIRGIREGRLVPRFFWCDVPPSLSIIRLPIKFDSRVVTRIWKEQDVKLRQNRLHRSKQLCLDEAWRLEDRGQGLHGRPGAQELETWLLKNHPLEAKPSPKSSTYGRILTLVRDGIRTVADDKRLSPAKRTS